MCSVSLQCGLFICLSDITCVGAFISLRGTINNKKGKGKGVGERRKGTVPCERIYACIPMYERVHMCACMCMFMVLQRKESKS